MTFTFRPAVRENVPLLIGLAGGTGSGKTYTALRLAAGMAGDARFAVIDTESGRAKAYADTFKFDHGDMSPPFSPMAYEEAILAADKAGYPVIVVDSMSHEHAGEGGLLDWQDAELQRMAGDDWAKRERVKMAAWIKPKTAHKHMVQRLLQVRAHLILCFRAEEKIEMVKNAQGRLEIQKKVTRTGKDGWVPICEKNLPYELTASFLLTDERPGVPLPIKLQQQHRELFPLDKPITQESGCLIAAWASGVPSSEAAAGGSQPVDASIDSASSRPMLGVKGGQIPAMRAVSEHPRITASEAADIETLCLDNSISAKALAKAAGVEFITQIPASELKKTHERIDAMVARRQKGGPRHE